jgi:SAM-dependent methyltransferase
MQAVGKAYRFYKGRGLRDTLKRAATVLLRRDSYKNYIRRTGRMGTAEIFTGIYERNIWKNAESMSGYGSTLEYTKSVRDALPVIFDELEIRSIVDAPCGDFNWMQRIPLERIRYCGIDIVPRLINENNIRYGSANVRFVCGDISRTSFPDADLLFCRDCLFHLSFSDIRGFLQSFVGSNIKYLMTTTHKNPYRFKNVDITTGDFRVIDLFLPPFGFSHDVLFRVDDYLPPDPAREMCVWSTEQIQASLLWRHARSNS